MKFKAHMKKMHIHSLKCNKVFTKTNNLEKHERLPMKLFNIVMTNAVWIFFFTLENTNRLSIKLSNTNVMRNLPKQII